MHRIATLTLLVTSLCLANNTHYQQIKPLAHGANLQALRSADEIILTAGECSVLLGSSIKLPENHGFTGFSVMIEKAEAGDSLVLTNIKGYKTSWDKETATLTVKAQKEGVFITSELIQSLSLVVKQAPTLSSRRVKISFIDPSYGGKTGHYYQVIKSQKPLSWEEANAAAKKMKKATLSGYLATITSQEEQAIVASKVTADAWIGGNDVNHVSGEGHWIWATGPDSGSFFWYGDTKGSAINGSYANWDKTEPNNLEDEGHLQIYGPAYGFRWNDIVVHGRNRIASYVVEFGGYPGEVWPQMELVRTITWSDSATAVTLMAAKDGDKDGTTDAFEKLDGTNEQDPNSFLDSDKDGVPDYIEALDGTDRQSVKSHKDSDKDGVPDYVEVVMDGTNPYNDNDFRDDDKDGVPTYAEQLAKTDPQNRASFKDSDGDGVPDYFEGKHGTDPLNAKSFMDSDNDGIPTYVEITEMGDPSNDKIFPDSDGDGVPDYVEVRQGTNPQDSTSYKDHDGDGVSDYALWQTRNRVDAAVLPYEMEKLHGDLAKKDSDLDGIPDVIEEQQGTSTTDATSFLDSDKDGVSDYQESLDGTDPQSTTSFKDSDGDGVSDAQEKSDGTNPNDSLSVKKVVVEPSVVETLVAVTDDTPGSKQAIAPSLFEVRLGGSLLPPRADYNDSTGDVQGLHVNWLGGIMLNVGVDVGQFFKVPLLFVNGRYGAGWASAEGSVRNMYMAPTPIGTEIDHARLRVAGFTIMKKIQIHPRWLAVAELGWEWQRLWLTTQPFTDSLSGLYSVESRITEKDNGCILNLGGEFAATPRFGIGLSAGYYFGKTTGAWEYEYNEDGSGWKGDLTVSDEGVAMNGFRLDVYARYSIPRLLKNQTQESAK